jgi:hypothetical protein
MPETNQDGISNCEKLKPELQHKLRTWNTLTNFSYAISGTSGIARVERHPSATKKLPRKP